MKNNNKTIMVYLFLAVFAFVFNKIYALFSHGVSSDAMSNMFLYLLILGTIVYVAIQIAAPKIMQQKGYRLFCNVYNSGVAILLNGMLLKGILEIAGSNSKIVPLFFYVGYLLIGLGVILFFLLVRIHFYHLR